jgi:hypothetical protein
MGPEPLGVAALTSTFLPFISCIEPSPNTAATDSSSSNVMKLQKQQQQQRQQQQAKAQQHEDVEGFSSCRMQGSEHVPVQHSNCLMAATKHLLLLCTCRIACTSV